MTLQSNFDTAQTEVVMMSSEVGFTEACSSQRAATLTWAEVFHAGSELCGGKGYNLGRLARYGFRIPRGGVIPAAWYMEILSEVPQKALAMISAIPAKGVLEPDVQAALAAIRTVIETATIPPALELGLTAFLKAQLLSETRVSVRSSATMEDGARASFAGIHRSFLNLQGVPEIL